MAEEKSNSGLVVAIVIIVVIAVIVGAVLFWYFEFYKKDQDSGGSNPSNGVSSGNTGCCCSGAGTGTPTDSATCGSSTWYVDDPTCDSCTATQPAHGPNTQMVYTITNNYTYPVGVTVQPPISTNVNQFLLANGNGLIPIGSSVQAGPVTNAGWITGASITWSPVGYATSYGEVTIPDPTTFTTITVPASGGTILLS